MTITKHLVQKHLIPVPASDSKSDDALYDGKEFQIGTLVAIVDNRCLRKTPIVETRAVINAPVEFVWEQLCDMRSTEEISSGLAHYGNYPVLDPLKDEYRLLDAELPTMPKWVTKLFKLRSRSEVQTLAKGRWFYMNTIIDDPKGRVWLRERCEVYVAPLSDTTTAYYMTDYLIGNPIIKTLSLWAAGGFRKFKKTVYVIVQRVADYIEKAYAERQDD